MSKKAKLIPEVPQTPSSPTQKPKAESRARENQKDARRSQVKQSEVGKSEFKDSKEKKTAKKRPPSHKEAIMVPLHGKNLRKLAQDLYHAATLNIWSRNLKQAEEVEAAELTAAQDAICDAADLLKQAKKKLSPELRLFWVACFNRKGLPSTTPIFVTAPDPETAIKIWRQAFKGEYGRRRPRAELAPVLASEPTLHV